MTRSWSPTINRAGIFNTGLLVVKKVVKTIAVTLLPDFCRRLPRQPEIRHAECNYSPETIRMCRPLFEIIRVGVFITRMLLPLLGGFARLVAADRLVETLGNPLFHVYGIIE